MHTLDTPIVSSAQADTGTEFPQALIDPGMDPLFWRPDRIDARSAWCEHIPFGHWLVGVTKPRLLVELGTHAGVSYSAFCLAVERNRLQTRCHAVDTWKGDEHAGEYGDQIFHELDAYHRGRFSSFSTLMRTTFDEAVSHFVDGTIDLLHIDGLHTYEAVKHDFLTWKPKLSDRAIVLFHDTNERKLDFGVWKLWSELRSEYPSFEFLHGHGLGVLAVGESASSAVLALSQLESSAVATVRDRFAFLGERWEVERRERWLEASLPVAVQEAAARVQADAQQATASAQAAFQHAAEQERQLSDELARQHARADAAEAALSQSETNWAAKAEEKRAAYAALVQAEAQVRSANKALNEERERHSEELSTLNERARKLEERAQIESVARSEIQDARAKIEDALRKEQALRAAMESSTAWRITRPLRTTLATHPGARRVTRRIVKATAWTISGQLRTRLAERKRVLSDARIIGDSNLFDGGWYNAEYPDAAASGLPAAFHYALVGRDARNPSQKFDAKWYMHEYSDVFPSGLNPLVHYEKYGKREGRIAKPVSTSIPAQAPVPAQDPLPVHPIQTPVVEASALEIRELLSRQFDGLTPLRLFRVAGEPRRVTMVTDSIGPGSLFGGVATAIVFSTMLAKRLGAQLRLVTRTEAANPQVFGDILRLNHIEWHENVDFVYSGPSVGHNVPIGDDDVFVTTSWWTTRSVRQAVHPSKIVYLLQEDERMFYPYGDDRLRCAETINDPDIRYVINTKILFDHLTTGVDHLVNVARKGTWFEPAFPSIAAREVRPSMPDEKRKFFFYARPNNARNLYWRGLEAIRACLEDGILDPKQWEFHFAGKDMHHTVLPHGIRPHLHQNMPWRDYVHLIEKIDVGLSLMDTPHPSYPPLDLAAAGAVVVTNRHGRKISLDQYSQNIICADPTVEGLKLGIANAVSLSDDKTLLCHNLRCSRIGRDWSASLADCLNQICTETIVGETHV